jgi:hypothetical protein
VQVLQLYCLYLIGFAEKEPGELLDRHRPERIGCSEGSSLALLSSCTPSGRECRRFQGRQVAIERALRSLVAFGSQFCFQLGPVAISLVPALEKVGVVRIKQARSLPPRAGIGGAAAEPVSNGSLRPPYAHRNVSSHQPLFSQCHDGLVAFSSLRLAGLVCMLDCSRPGRTMLLGGVCLFLLWSEGCLLCTTQRGKAVST